MSRPEPPSRLRPTLFAAVMGVVVVTLTTVSIAIGNPYPGAFAGGIALTMVWSLWQANKRAGTARVDVRRGIPKKQIKQGDRFMVVVDPSRSKIPKGFSLSLDDLPAERLEASHSRPMRTGGIAYQARATTRGPTRFGDIHAELQDGTGFWSQPHTVAASHDLHVLPGDEARRVGQRITQPSRMDHGLPDTVQHLWRDQSDGRVMPYGPGHRFRDIDWKAFARHRKLLVREWAHAPSATLTLMVDAGKHMCQGPEPRVDAAVDMALELADAALQYNHAVGVVMFNGDRVIGRWRPARDRGALQRLRDGMAATARSARTGGRSLRHLHKRCDRMPLPHAIRTAPSGQRGGRILMVADPRHLSSGTVGHLAHTLQRGQNLLLFPTASPDGVEELSRLVARGAEVMPITAPATAPAAVPPTAPATTA